MSALDWSPFEPELLAANVAARELDDGRPLHPCRCGPCVDCAEHLGRPVVPARWASPSLERFVAHARAFGVECVAEVAAEHLAGPELERLRVELDAIEAERKAGRFTVGRRRRRTEAETARYALALEQELAGQGLRGAALEQRIADRLGVSDTYARRLLKRGRIESETPENAPRKPTVQAESFATKRESGIGAQPAGFGWENGS